MNPLDDMTVCVTNFKRPEYLDRALTSLAEAGIQRVAVASIEPNQKVRKIIEDHAAKTWLSFDVATVAQDIGCNNTWMLAAYRSRTDRIIILHDDDVLQPAFGQAYREQIAPVLYNDKLRVKFASWRAHVLNEDQTIRETEYWTGPTQIQPSRALASMVARFNTLSLSPVISILDRKTVIRACKEAEATLTHNDCLERPGMLLGTEILVYLRHCQMSQNWLYVDKVLSLYGSHIESGTVRAERSGDLRPLTRGYDRARTQGIMQRAPTPKPKLILVHQPFTSPDDAENKRIEVAHRSWDFHFGTFDMIDCPVHQKDLPRDGTSVGDSRPTPFVRDVIEAGFEMAMPEDIIVYVNEDIGLTVDAPARLIAGLERGHGVTICPRRVLTNPDPDRLYRTVRNCKVDGGMDVVAMTPAWWKWSAAFLPDLLLAREAWDLCMRTLAEEWSDGGGFHHYMTIQPEDMWRSRAYTDDVCWHKPHDSFWKVDRKDNAGGKHNRKLARAFFEFRENLVGISCVAEPVTAPPVQTINFSLNPSS